MKKQDFRNEQLARLEGGVGAFRDHSDPSSEPCIIRISCYIAHLVMPSTRILELAAGVEGKADA
jgi:hypothetical protein